MAKLTVIDCCKGQGKLAEDREAAMKRLALQIAVQLPEKREEALRVLMHTRTLVDSFLGAATPV